MTVRHTLLLTGCHPRPLASYLKAVAVLRLVAEQVDSGATACWQGDDLELTSTLDAVGLRRFFSQDYRPTPVISPWNGGSGFYPGDNQSGIEPISQATQPRFAAYAQAIQVARQVMADQGVQEKVKDGKAVLLERLRAELPDDALPWLDAAVLLTADGLKFPPLLGTGGNDGRLDFSNNFMQRLWAMEQAGAGLQAQWLDNSLLGTPTPKLVDAAIGQFLPSHAGGFNTSFGFDGKSRVNPWDFVLLVEGALAFAAAAVRKLEGAEAAAMVFPFMVRAAGAGYASATDKDESDTRDELWLPLWSQPATWRELRQLLGEGRAMVSAGGGPRPAVSALDFARALGDLGVDRGIIAFERYGFHTRNGLSTLAVPLGRWQVRRNPSAARLAGLDAWLDRFRRAASDANGPASLRRLRRRLDEAVLAVCAQDTWPNRRTLLLTLGQAELQLNKSIAFARDKGVAPVPWLDPQWLPAPDEQGVEERLAIHLAAAGLRHRFSLAEGDRVLSWAKVEDPARVWSGTDLHRDLAALALRQDVERAQRGQASPPTLVGADLADLAAFLAHQTDDPALADLALAFALLRPAELQAAAGRVEQAEVPYLFALLALAHGDAPLPLDTRGRIRDGDPVLPPVPGLLRRALAGDDVGSSRLALRRLRASGLPARAFAHRRPEARDIGLSTSPDLTRRAAVALAFPLSVRARAALVARTLVLPTDLMESA
ncbi:type I-U CRISPR-associated protein Csx17 [Myxococcota bacterium]|nr:type I-U CRISPR-associated protein Csx17 [Myxococcota bacterium]